MYILSNNDNRLIRSAACLIVLMTLTALCRAEDKITAIQGGDVYTITGGIIRNGTVLIKGTQIEQVGSNIAVPKGATVINAKGKVVMPGFVAVYGRLGGGYGGKIADSLDPFSQSVSLALASGVTSVYVSSGSDAVLKPTYGDLDGMIVKESVFKRLSFSNRNWLSKTNTLIALRDARTYMRDLDRYNREKAAGKNPTALQKPSGVDSYLPMLQRKVRVLVSANSAADILAVLELVDEFGIDIIIDGGNEAWTVADEIAEQKVDCIITPRYKLRPDRDKSGPSGSDLRNAAILKKAGVKFAILPPSTSFTSSTSGIAGRDLLTLPMDAAFAVSGGLDEQTALESITITAAKILGVENRVGSIQPGKDADIIIMDGHPFHHNTFVETTIVNGKVLYEKDKSTYFSHIKNNK
jgi:imidazolonepropionase-like amidohydrolase